MVKVEIEVFEGLLLNIGVYRQVGLGLLGVDLHSLLEELVLSSRLTERGELILVLVLIISTVGVSTRLFNKLDRNQVVLV